MIHECCPLDFNFKYQAQKQKIFSDVKYKSYLTYTWNFKRLVSPGKEFLSKLS